MTLRWDCPSVAAVPVLTLFFVLVVLKARVWVAAFSGMVAAILLANLVFGMPATLVAAAPVAWGGPEPDPAAIGPMGWVAYALPK